MFENTLIDNLTMHKKLPLGIILSYGWMGNPETKQKSCAFMVITLSDKPIAGKVARGGLFLHSLYLRGQACQKSPLQCLGEGHVAAKCSSTVPPKCVNNKKKGTQTCELPSGTSQFFNFINSEKTEN